MEPTQRPHAGREFILLLRPIRRQLVVVSCIFALALAGGGIFSEYLQPLTLMVFDMLADAVLDDPGGNITASIIMNNIRVTFLALVLGFTILQPIILVLVNGLVIGAVAAEAPLDAVLYSIPHAFFELPAVLLASAAGLYIGNYFAKISFKQRFYHALKVWALAVLPLLLIAGIIEGAVIDFILGP